MAERLTPEQVREIRERHEWLRQFRKLYEDDPDAGRQTDAELDAKVAKEFGISRVYVAALVTGKSRPEVDGPLDAARVRIQELFIVEAAELGPDEANRRRSLRRRGIDPEPKAIRWSQRAVIVDSKGRDTEMSYTLEPGHSIRVDLVAEGGR